MKPADYLTKLVLGITVEAQQATVPLWRAQTVAAKILLTVNRVYEESKDPIDVTYANQIRPHVETLLRQAGMDPEVIIGDDD